MHRHLLVSLLLLQAPVAFAQFGGQNTGNVNVRVTYGNSHPCLLQLRVQLFDSSGSTPVAETFTNDSGMAEFARIKVATYHIMVSGEGVENADSGVFEVDSRKMSQFVYITVKPTADQDTTASKSGSGPSIAAIDLHVPEEARKEFDKAGEQLAKENWKKAIERLLKAVGIYPKYAAAYTNLGVAYGRSGDPAAEREAFQKAISLNDKFAPAYVNLAKLEIKTHNFPEAESLLDRATSADPTDPQTMLLLANVQLLNGRYEPAIANCHKLHAMQPDKHALAHYIAARALEHQNHPDAAFAELETFLKEEPAGPRADAVRKEMSGLQAYAHSGREVSQQIPRGSE